MAKTKKPRAKKTKEEPAPIVLHSEIVLDRHTEIAVLYMKDGQHYWVRGYEILDPLTEHSTNKGCSPLDIKRFRHEHYPVVRKGQQGRPVLIHESRLSIVKPGSHYFTFEQVFRSTSDIASVVIDVAIEAEKEDLNFGINPFDNIDDTVSESR